MGRTVGCDTLADVESIRALKYTYGRHVDKRNWDSFVDLFTEDATCTYDTVGTFSGHDELYELGEIFRSEVAYSCHLFHHPVIDVTGDTATGDWTLISLIGLRDGPFEWRQGRYQEAYRRVDDTWKFTEIALEHEVIGTATYEFVDHADYGYIPRVE